MPISKKVESTYDGICNKWDLYVLQKMVSKTLRKMKTQNDNSDTMTFL